LDNADEPLINPTGLDHPESRQNLTLHQSRFLSSGGNNFSGWALSIDDVPEGVSEELGTIANAIVWLPGVSRPICGVGVVVLTQQLGKVIQTPLLVT